ncbi:MAG TPA: hypothetical protein DCY88_12255 [Cyanobacteria bacterium UBA11372]|nr:hypothetical protein [Cyanobacteria bacterium UBA11372]
MLCSGESNFSQKPSIATHSCTTSYEQLDSHTVMTSNGG